MRKRKNNKVKKSSDFIPIQNTWESQATSATVLALGQGFSEVSQYLNALPDLVGTGPSTRVVLSLQNSQFCAYTGAFDEVFGMKYLDQMKLDLLVPFIHPDHNAFMSQHFPTYLNYLLSCAASKRDQVEYSVTFKYKRRDKYFWLNQRTFKYFSDESNSLIYLILEFTDITTVKNDETAKLIAYDKNDGYILNELLHPVDSLVHSLSPTELVITKLISNGKSDKEIGTIQGVSTGTIKQHKKHIFTKLNIHKSTELVSIAFHSGLMN